MEFPKTTKEEDKICYEEGFRIFGELRKKYSNNNVRDLDIVLNSLCAALARLTEINVRPADHQTFIGLIAQILTKNLKVEQK